MRAVKCPKCGAMCLLAMVDGFKAAVDPAKLDADGVREVLMAGRSVYGTRGRMDFREIRYQLKGLFLLTPSTLGAHLRDANATLGEHACGNAAFSGVPMDAPPKALSGPSATSGGLVGGFPPSDAHEGSSGPPVAPNHQPAATSATRLPSDESRNAYVAALIVRELDATVVSIDIEGRNVYTRP